MAGPLAVGQQVQYERIAARAGRVVRVGHPNDTIPACAAGHAGATGLAGLLAGNNLIIILRPAAAVIAPAGFLLENERYFRHGLHGLTRIMGLHVGQSTR